MTLSLFVPIRRLQKLLAGRDQGSGGQVGEARRIYQWSDGRRRLSQRRRAQQIAVGIKGLQYIDHATDSDSRLTCCQCSQGTRPTA